MEENTTTMTDDQVSEFIDTAESANLDNDTIQKLRDIKKGNIDLDALLDDETEEKKMVASINPISGQTEGAAVAYAYGQGKGSDIFEDFLNDTGVGMEIDDIDLSDVEKAVKPNDMYMNNDVEMKEYEIIKTLLVRRNNGDQIKYSDLPPSLQSKVNNIISSNAGAIPIKASKEVRNSLANSVIETIYTDIVGNKINDVCIDLQTSIKNFAKNEINDIQTESRKKYHDTFINKFAELAEKYDETDEKKAKLIRDISNGYQQAHSLEDMYIKYTTTGKLKVKRIDIEKIDRLLNEFNMKYEHSTMVIKDISPAAIILDRHVNKRFSATAIKAFLAVFCKYTMNMKPTNIAEHTFMYYFIMNIISLDIYNTNDEDDKNYYEEFIENINKFLMAITDKMKL